VPAVAVLHRGASARAGLRRGLARHPGRPRILSCRSAEDIERLLRSQLLDALILDPRVTHAGQVFGLMAGYPGIPVFALSAFRPDDGQTLLTCRRAGVRGILVEGVDGAAAGEWIGSRTASRRRRHLLRDAPVLLRLTEPFQVRVWDEVLQRVGMKSRTADLAGTFKVTREHLSREFGAGGAPNLKRVIDLVHVCCAAELLGNPAYDVVTVARILRYASASHLGIASRRIAGVTPTELSRLGPRQVFLRFLKGRTRSRA
jgi:AraC-like DNA-binding protein